MKKILHAVAFVCLAIAAQAQNLTTVTGSNVQDLSGAKLGSGQICFQATDASDIPVSFQAGGGGQVVRRPYCSPVTVGVITSFTVPNPALTVPAGINYRVSVKDTTLGSATNGQEILRYKNVSFVGAGFNFDSYGPTIGSVVPLTGTSTSGSLAVNGNLTVTGPSMSIGGPFVANFAPLGTMLASWNADITTAATLKTSIGADVSVNGSVVALPNFNATTPAAPAGNANCTPQVAGSSVSCYFPSAQTSLSALPTGDLLCAHGNDTTIGLLTITNITGSPGPFVITAGVPTTAQYIIGQTINVAGVTPGSLNGSYTITAVSGSTITATPNAAQTGTYTSGGTVNMVCNNSSDLTAGAATAFASTLTVPAPASFPTRYILRGQFETWTTATVPGLVLPSPFYSATQLMSWSGNGTLRATNAGVGGAETWSLVFPVTNYINISGDSQTLGISANNESSAAMTSIGTTSPTALSLKTGFALTGIASGTYTSGGSITGTVGQTCTLSTFNNGNSGGTATVALTGTNVIAGGTALVITNTGFASTSAATTATLGNGTATCSGTATIATVLGGAQGNAIRLIGLWLTPQL